ncbi:multidrug effflux MFS transporter [Kitasatospora sp. NPDC002227]|uniref:multidrug effflux MFS transporter n=1 Tax=Kitasatospora sp. NPDC002227 TaxID=3154773 RepID=UPI00332016FF
MPTPALSEQPTDTGTTAADRPARVVVVLLGGLVALGPLTTDLYLPSLPTLTRELGSTAPAVQLTLTSSLIGLALGQLFFGPLSDRLGRRLPLVLGMTVYTLATVLCALAPSVPVLVAGRALQGAAGASGLVIGRAIARDRYEGPAMIRFLATLGVVSGLAPIFAPLIGAQLLRFTSWRGTFATLAVLGGLLTLGALLRLPESLPAERRHSDGVGSTVRAIGGLLRDRIFLGYVLTSTFAFGALFAYVGGSSVVLQTVYQISPQTFSLLFATNSVAVVGFTQLNGRVLVQRLDSAVLMRIGLGCAVAAGTALVLCTAVWDTGLAGVWPALFLLMASMGIVLPNSAGQALTMAPHAAGSASALIGLGTYLCGAVVAPLSSAGGTPSAVLLGAVVLSCAALATLSFVTLCRPTAEAQGR